PSSSRRRSPSSRRPSPRGPPRPAPPAPRSAPRRRRVPPPRPRPPATRKPRPPPDRPPLRARARRRPSRPRSRRRVARRGRPSPRSARAGGLQCGPLAAHELGQAEREVERLPRVQARIAERLVAVVELLLGKVLGAAETLGDVLARVLEVHAPGPD